MESDVKYFKEGGREFMVIDDSTRLIANEADNIRLQELRAQVKIEAGKIKS